MRQKTHLELIPEFEALRALSIILLLTLHSDVLSLNVYGVEIGYSAAFMGAFLLGSFFFLAGYFTDVSLGKPGRTFFSFVKSKFIRIYPPYWLALLMFILVLGYSLKRFDFGVYAANLQFIFSPAVVKQMLTLWYVSIVAAYYAVFSILIVRGHSNLALPAWSVAVFLAAYAFHLATGLVDVRFFEYYFIFLAGIFFSRFAEIRERLSSLHFVYKIILAVLGAWLFWLVQAAGYKVTDVRYLLAVDFYILSWIWMWLGIFGTSVGGWRIWAPVSTASFFAYLYHRPMWEVLVTLFDVEPGKPDMLFKFLPGSLIVLIISYSMQRGYDRLIRLLKLSS